MTVRTLPSSNPEMMRFEINRSLTGMGHERYRSLDDILRHRPVDVLARRLLELGGIDAVHVNSSVITVDLSGGSTGEGLAEIIENLFRYYPDEPPAAEAADGEGDGAGVGGADAADDAADDAGGEAADEEPAPAG